MLPFGDYIVEGSTPKATGPQPLEHQERLLKGWIHVHNVGVKQKEEAAKRIAEHRATVAARRAKNAADRAAAQAAQAAAKAAKPKPKG